MQALADELKDPFEANDFAPQISDQSLKFPITQFTTGVDMTVFKLMDAEVCKEKDVHWDHDRLLDSILSELNTKYLRCSVENATKNLQLGVKRPS